MTNFPVGQGLFFAGQNHVHIQVIASPTETALITTNPQQLEELARQQKVAQEIHQADFTNQPTSPPIVDNNEGN